MESKNNSNYLERYRIEILLLILQLTPAATISLILASVYAFYIVGFKREIDLLSIFLLLLPSIVFREASESFSGFVANRDTFWWRFYIPTLTSTIILGPLAVSVKLFSALAVPVRLARSILVSKNKLNMFLYFIAVAISIFGLYVTFISGSQSAGGNTVGLRIALSVGVLLFPKLIRKEAFSFQIESIIKISILLLASGLLTAHWIFVTVSFISIVLFSKKYGFWMNLFSLVSLALIFYSGNTVTIYLIIIISFVFQLWLYYQTKSGLILKFNKTFAYLLIPVPFVLAIIIAIGSIQWILSIFNVFENTEYIQAKLLEDRGGLWVYVWEMILNSNFWLVEAARPVFTYNYAFKGGYDWEFGAHNIFLETLRQIGSFASIILFFFIFKTLFAIFKKFDDLESDLKRLLLSLFAVYLAFGFTGNSLIYDGVGFLFWLILSQMSLIHKKVLN